MNKLYLIRLKTLPESASRGHTVKLRTEHKGYMDQVTINIPNNKTAIIASVEYLESLEMNVVGWGHYSTIPHILVSNLNKFVS